MPSPTPIIVTDVNGNALTVLGTTSGTQFAAPTPVVFTDVNGNALTLGASFPVPSGSTATTQAPGDNTTKIATDAFVTTAVTGLAPLASPTFTGTVALPAATVASTITSYNGQALVIPGLPTLIAQINTTGLVANVSIADLVSAASMTSAMLLEVHAEWIVTTVGTTSTLPTLNITWTDSDNSAAQSIAQGAGNTSYAGAGITATTNTTATRGQVVGVCNCKSGVALQYSTSGYASTGTAMQYALRIRVIRLA